MPCREEESFGPDGLLRADRLSPRIVDVGRNAEAVGMRDALDNGVVGEVPAEGAASATHADTAGQGPDLPEPAPDAGLDSPTSDQAEE